VHVTPRRLNVQLILLVSCILLATGATSGWITARIQSNTLLATMRGNSELMVRSFAENAVHYLVLEDYAGLESILLKSADLPDIVRLQVCETDGTVIGNVEHLPGTKPRSQPVIQHLSPPASPMRAIVIENEDLIIWEPIKAGSMLGWIKATYSLAGIRKAQTETWKNVILLSLFWIACSIALFLFTLRPIVRAVNRLTAFARSLDEHKGEQIDAEQGAIEIRELSASLNYASTRLFATEQDLLHEKETLSGQYSTLRGIIDSVNDLIFSVDRQYRYTSFNSAHAAVMRTIYGVEIRTGECLLDFMQVPEDREKAKQNLDRALAGERFSESSFSGEEVRSRLYFEVSHNPILAVDGSVIGVAVLSRNMTEHKRTDDALRKSEESYRQLLDTIQEGIWSIDQEAITTFVNPRMAEILGYASHEMLGKHLFSFMDEQGRLIAERNIERRKQGIKEQHDFEFIKKDGSRIYARLETGPILDADGQYTGAIASVSDITERREAELRLRASEQAFRAVVENSPDVIVRYDRKGRRIYVNPEFERVNHLTAQQVLGKTPAELSTELAPMADVFTEKLMAAMTSGAVSKIDLSWTRNGKPVCWFVRIMPEFDEGGNVVSALTIWSDISERKRMEDELRGLNEELEQRVKDRTAELVQKNKDLEKMNKLFVGRELKMVELKQKLKTLGHTTEKDA